MGRLNNISGKEAVRAFIKAGWVVRGQVGSHVVMTKENVKANLSVPQHKEWEHPAVVEGFMQLFARFFPIHRNYKSPAIVR